MINIYLCEDNKEQLDNWEKIINNHLLMNHLNERLAFSTQSPEELLLELKNHPSTMGLYFLDICLNSNINGLQLASEIRAKDPIGEIVFITSRSEMCYLTYEYQVRALDFIVKDNVADFSSKIKKCMIAALQKELQIQQLSSEPLYLKISGERIYFNPDDIIYIETKKDSIHKITIYTTNGLESTYGTLKEMENLLSRYSCFHRCYKSIIVNKKYIKKVNSQTKELYLTTGITLPASSRYLRQLNKEL